MNARVVALAAGLPFILGVAVGATAVPAGIAAADQPQGTAEMMTDMPMAGMSMDAMVRMHAADPEAMDAMHASMRAEMPDELREACDAMHAAMSDGDGMPMRGGMPADHADHHR